MICRLQRLSYYINVKSKYPGSFTRNQEARFYKWEQDKKTVNIYMNRTDIYDITLFIFKNKNWNLKLLSEKEIKKWIDKHIPKVQCGSCLHKYAYQLTGECKETYQWRR